MTRLETLRSLQTRLRDATGPDRRIDVAILDALSDPSSIVLPHYTADPDGLGACVALMRSVLPGWLFDIRQQHPDDFQARVHRWRSYLTLPDDVFASHRLATHATLLATVSALIAIEEQAKETPLEPTS